MELPMRHGSPIQPQLIESCRIHISAELGRFIAVVSKDSDQLSSTLTGGTRIFTAPELPYASILHDEHLGSRCEECFRQLSTKVASPVTCPGCALTRFCSPQCLQTGFQAWHGFECGLWSGPQNKGDSLDFQQQQQQDRKQQGQFSMLARLALRVFWKKYRRGTAGMPMAASEKQELPLNEDGHGMKLDHLCTNQSKVDKAILAQDREEAEVLIRWLDLPTAVFAPHLAMLMAVLRSNAIGIRVQERSSSAAQVSGENDVVQDSTKVLTQESVMVGTGLYLLTSMINHSCAPNAMILFGDDAKTEFSGGGKEPSDNMDPRALNVVVTQDVPYMNPNRGDAAPSMVTISYGPQKGRMAKADRKKLLLEKYCFDCQCMACSANEDVSKLQDLIRKLQLKVAQESQQDKAGYSPFQVLTVLHQLEVAQAMLYSTHSSQEYGATCDELARVYAERGDFEASAAWSEKSLAIVQHHYGNDSIEAAQEMFKLAGLLFNSRRPKETLELIEKIIPLYEKHFGAESNNEELQEMKEMELCLRQYLQ
ncbi:SET and MYND domain-containing protein 4 [Actinomortierella ambigua]|nr:SET and MYND domain-containing protein 4 [Actinomortierella ambigua]